MTQESGRPIVKFVAAPCPECGAMTSLVHLGTESPREICPTLSCDWDGMKLLVGEQTDL